MPPSPLIEKWANSKKWNRCVKVMYHLWLIWGLCPSPCSGFSISSQWTWGPVGSTKCILLVTEYAYLILKKLYHKLMSYPDAEVKKAAWFLNIVFWKLFFKIHFHIMYLDNFLFFPLPQLLPDLPHLPIYPTWCSLLSKKIKKKKHPDNQSKQTNKTLRQNKHTNITHHHHQLQQNTKSMVSVLANFSWERGLP